MIVLYSKMELTKAVRVQNPQRGHTSFCFMMFYGKINLCGKVMQTGTEYLVFKCFLDVFEKPNPLSYVWGEI